MALFMIYYDMRRRRNEEYGMCVSEGLYTSLLAFSVDTLANLWIQVTVTGRSTS